MIITGTKGRMKTTSVTFAVRVAASISIVLLAAVTVLAVNDAYAPDAYIKLGEIKGEAKGSEKANDIAGDTSTRNEHTEFARDKISETADRLSDDVD
jgi:hypothetical protein